MFVELSRLGVDIILHIGPDDVLCAFGDTCTFVQQCTLCIAMWKYSDASREWFDRISIHDSFAYAGNEERSLASFEFVVQVDQKGEERRLACGSK